MAKLWPIEEELCVICMETTEDKWTDCPNRCQVYAHIECLKQWKIKSRGRCLICKKRKTKHDTFNTPTYRDYSNILSFLIMLVVLSYVIAILWFTIWFVHKYLF